MCENSNGPPGHNKGFNFILGLHLAAYIPFSFKIILENSRPIEREFSIISQYIL
jgi:hypothetical protein